MTIRLADMARQILTEGGKLFGDRAQRVTTDEMGRVYSELKGKIGHKFSRFKLSKALPSKKDHGDIDIVVSGVESGISLIIEKLYDKVLAHSKNGNIYSILYHSDRINKNVHVDFISASEDDYDTQFDYLSYNDFSGVIGILSRQLHFKYGTDGFFKVYEDKSGRYHYLKITKNLRDGLKILGYERVLGKYDEIQSPDDIVNFIASSDLFDSDYFSSDSFNYSDRRRTRISRSLAVDIRDKLLELKKKRIQPDEDYFLKKLFPQKYSELIDQEQEIENKVAPKSVYDGKWILTNFPEIKPGPMIGKIKLYLAKKFGSTLETTPDDEAKAAVRDFIKNTTP